METKSKVTGGYLFAVVSLMIVAAAIIFVGGLNANKEIDSLSTLDRYNLVRDQSGQVAGVSVEQVEVKVDLSDQTVLTTNIEISDGDTVMDALRQMIRLSGLVFSTTKYDFGEIVDQIGDLKGGQDNKYWIYYVNGESALVSADTMEVKAGDIIEFKFEESIF